MESIAYSAPLGARWSVAEEPATYGVVRPTVYLDTTIPSYFTNLGLPRVALMIRRRKRAERERLAKESAERAAATQQSDTTS